VGETPTIKLKISIQLECQAEPVEAGLHKRTRLRQAQADKIQIGLLRSKFYKIQTKYDFAN
jgi:hypothetical protein